MQRTLSKINYLYIIIVLLWVPLYRLILNFDGRERIIFTLTLVIFFINMIYDNRFRILVFSKPVVFWGAWVLYSTMNSLLTDYHGTIPLMSFIVLQIVLPFVVLVITCREWVVARWSIYKFLTVVFLIYCILSLILSLPRYGQLINNVDNAYALNAVFLIFFSSLLLVNKLIKPYTAFFVITLAFLVIFIIATRKAFVASIIIISFTILSQFTFSFKRLVFITSVAVGLTWSFGILLENTALGDRFSEIENEAKVYNTSNLKAFDVLGDRAFYYIKGWSIFREYPLTGVGLGNFGSKIGSKMRVHSEYMVQLTEGGILGSFLFILFNMWLIMNLIKRWKRFPQDRPNIWVLSGGLVAILFLNFTTWTYAFPRYFTCFGIIIGYLLETKKDDCYTQ